MKTRDQVLADVKSGAMRSECLDGRDFNRLCGFFPVSDWEVFGCILREGASGREPDEWSQDVIIELLRVDLEFAFEKAIDQRGLSANMMFFVIKMWLDILDEPLASFSESDYAPYGLPLFRAVAERFGWPIPEGGR